MGILKEWTCAAHGPFESIEQKCPHGCSSRFVRREIRTAPALGKVQNRNRDAIERDLAHSYGLTNMTNHQGDLSVMQGIRRLDWTKYQDPEKGYAPSFALDVPHAAPGWTQRGEQAPVFKPEGVGLQADSKVTPKQFNAPVPAIPKDSHGRPLAYHAPLPKVSE